MLQSFIARNILQLLDIESLINAEQVSACWKDVIVGGKLWEKLLLRKVLVPVQLSHTHHLVK